MAAPTKYNIENKYFYNNSGSRFRVQHSDIKNKRGQTQYLCVFDSGWECYAMSSDIRKGKVKDMLYPTVHNVGMLGFSGRRAKEQGRSYFLWLGMIRRCYDPSAPFYKWYGGRGVTVCERWKRFDYFLADYKSIPGFNQELFEAGELELDKDLIDPNKKVYSPETCSFVTHRENLEPVLESRYGKKYLNTK